MSMNAIGAIPVWASTATTSDGFIVSETLDFVFARKITAKSECQIIGVSLRSCTGFETFENYVCDTLTLERRSARAKG
jgi:hypothetical protein